MDSITRIKTLQTEINVKLACIDQPQLIVDGVIGKNTLLGFSAAYNLSKVQVVQTFANMHHESAGFTRDRENLYYTTISRLMSIFGVGKHSARITLSEGYTLLRKPERLAERVYGLGNPKKAKELGNTDPGDGYKHRGGGALQLTGKAGYKRVSEITGLDLVNNPNLINNEAYFLSAIAEFQYNNIWPLMMDLSPKNIARVRRKINGGLNGIADVKRLIQVYLRML